MMDQDKQTPAVEPSVYKLSIGVLGNEVLSFGVTASNSSNRWVMIGLITTISVVMLLSSYGSQLASLYQTVVN